MGFLKEVEERVANGQMTLAELNELVNDLNRLVYQVEAIQTARSEQYEC